MYKNPIPFAVKHKDYEVRISSRSGGMFTALSDYILMQNGVVYGCALDEDFMAVHLRATTKIERDAFRGSKYIQSNLNDVFTQIKTDLSNDRTVLFSGTSCQISGLNAYIPDEHKKRLLCVDIVCHGVPSPLVWRDYLRYYEKKDNSKVLSVNFRNKINYGWKSHIETIRTEKRSYNNKIFAKIFYGHNALRNSCYKCPYKKILHPGDITIADFWGIDNAVPGFNDNKGVSLVLVNNAKGMKIFHSVKSEVEYTECNIEDCLQPPLLKPFPEPEGRNQFWVDYYNKPFQKIARKYGGNKITIKIRNIMVKLIKPLITIIRTTNKGGSKNA